MAEIAVRQHGIVTLAQLEVIGIDRHAVHHRVSAGRLFTVHRGVYAVGRPPVTPLERASAAVLAGGPGALLSHSSAASLWGLTKRWDDPPHVSVQADRRPAGIVAHRSKGLTPTDGRTHLGIRVTSPARTLLDWAPELDEAPMRRAVNDARLAGYLHLPALQDVLERFPRHRGAVLLRPLLAGDSAPTRSEFEDAFLAFCASHDLPTPQVNVILAGYEVDALFPAQRLVVELDGYRYHSDRGAFERDRERDANLLAIDHATVRITWTRMTGRPAQEAARLRRILVSRG